MKAQKSEVSLLRRLARARSQKLNSPFEIITPPSPSYLFTPANPPECGKRGCRRRGRYFKVGAKGFTLIEIVMIIVIVSIAIPALLIVLGQETRQSVDAELQVSATNVAQALMEEIKTKCWDETATTGANCSGTVTPSATLASEGAECRTNCTGLQCGVNPIYNDVDDYNGLSETCSWGGPSFTTTVTVCYVPSGNLNDISACSTTTDFKRIQVDVQNASMGTINLVTLVGNY